MPGWTDVKSQMLNSIKEELYCEKNWNFLSQYFTDEKLDNYIIIPLLTKLNIHLKNYVLIFLGIHLLLILLILFNIFLSLCKKR